MCAVDLKSVAPFMCNTFGLLSVIIQFQYHIHSPIMHASNPVLLHVLTSKDGNN